MFENLTLADGVSSKIKRLMTNGQQLSFDINDEISGICFSKFDRINLSLIKSDKSKYFDYLEKLRDELMLKFDNLYDPISQEKYTKINFDLDRSMVFAKGGKYLLRKLAMKELFECLRKVSGKIKFYLYKDDNKSFLIAYVAIVIIGDK